MIAEAATETFAPPTAELVEHALRELEYGQHLVGYKMTPSAGNARTNMYSLPEAVLFLMGTNWDSPMLASGFKGSINWVEMTTFAQWLRDSVGDADLAAAVEEQVVPLDPYYKQVQALSALLTERMDQYRAVRGIAAEPSEQAEA